MLTPIGLWRLKKLENGLGDMASEDIIVALVWNSMRLPLKGQRLFGQFEDFFLIHKKRTMRTVNSNDACYLSIESKTFPAKTAISGQWHFQVRSGLMEKALTSVDAEAPAE